MTNFNAMNLGDHIQAIPINTVAEKYGLPMAIVVEACRVHFGTANLDDLNQLLAKNPQPLQQVALLSRLHRIRPVVYRVLLNAQIPAYFSQHLKNELHAITIQNFTIAQETERIVKLLAVHAIHVIPYKGVAFSKAFYGDISMRESSDIDLIINPADIDKLLPILIHDGYKCQYEKSLARIDRNILLKQQKDICFDKFGSTPFHLEFHWRITHPNFLTPKIIGEFSKDASGKITFSNMEHFRAVLLHHWLHDGLEYLKTLVDLTQGYLNLNRHELHQNITRINSSNGIDIVLALAGKIFGIEVYESNPKSKNEKRLIERIVNFNLGSKAGKSKGGTTLMLVKQYYRYYCNQLLFIDGLNKKLNFTFQFWAQLLSPKQGDVDLIGIPKYFQFLYFLIRPLRLLFTKTSVKQPPIK